MQRYLILGWFESGHAEIELKLKSASAYDTQYTFLVSLELVPKTYLPPSTTFDSSILDSRQLDFLSDPT